jgi:hypothetical protein
VKEAAVLMIPKRRPTYARHSAEGYGDVMDFTKQDGKSIAVREQLCTSIVPIVAASAHGTPADICIHILNSSIHFPMGMCMIPSLQIIVCLLWIPMVRLSLSHQYYNLHLMMTVFLLLLPMEPGLAPLGCPILMGPIGNLVIWYCFAMT